MGAKRQFVTENTSYVSRDTFSSLHVAAPARRMQQTLEEKTLGAIRSRQWHPVPLPPTALSLVSHKSSTDVPWFPVSPGHVHHARLACTAKSDSHKWTEENRPNPQPTLPTLPATRSPVLAPSCPPWAPRPREPSRTLKLSFDISLGPLPSRPTTASVLTPPPHISSIHTTRPQR